MNDNSALGRYVNHPINVVKFKKGETEDPTDDNSLWNITVREPLPADNTILDRIGVMNVNENKCIWVQDCKSAAAPSEMPSVEPTTSRAPSEEASTSPTQVPSPEPSDVPSSSSSIPPDSSSEPSGAPSSSSSIPPDSSSEPSGAPSSSPSIPPDSSSEPSGVPSSSPSIPPDSSSEPSGVPSSSPSVSPDSSSEPSTDQSQVPTIMPTIIEVGTFEDLDLAIADSTTANGFDSSRPRTIIFVPPQATTRTSDPPAIAFERNVVIGEKYFYFKCLDFTGSCTIDLNGYKFTTGCDQTAFFGSFAGMTIENRRNTALPSASPEPTPECKENTYGGAFFIRGDSAGSGLIQGPMDPGYPGAPSYLEIVDCTLQYNSALDGGVIDSISARLRFIRSRFFGNRATLNGGAVLANDGVLSLFECEFEDNSAGEDGGALYVQGGSRVSINSSQDRPSPDDVLPGPQAPTVFRGNTAGRAGGGLFIEETRLLVGNCYLEGSPSNPITRCFNGAFFENNSAGEYGGGLAIWSMEGVLDSIVQASRFTGNSAGVLGGGVNAFARGGNFPIIFRLVFDHTVFNGNGPDDVFDDSKCYVCDGLEEGEECEPLPSGTVTLSCNQEERCNQIPTSLQCDGRTGEIISDPQLCGMSSTCVPLP